MKKEVSNMSYTIIFETKIVKLPDGEILHLSLSGCNNDVEGRTRDDFKAKIYSSESDFTQEIEKWEKTESDYEGFDLKIGSRFCKWRDYGKHLRNMLRRAITIDELKKLGIRTYIYKGMRYIVDGSFKDYEPGAEADKIFFDVLYGRIKGTCKPLREVTSDLQTTIDAIKQYGGMNIRLYVGRKRKVA